MRRKMLAAGFAVVALILFLFPNLPDDIRYYADDYDVSAINFLPPLPPDHPNGPIEWPEGVGAWRLSHERLARQAQQEPIDESLLSRYRAARLTCARNGDFRCQSSVGRFLSGWAHTSTREFPPNARQSLYWHERAARGGSRSAREEMHWTILEHAGGETSEEVYQNLVESMAWVLLAYDVNGRALLLHGGCESVFDLKETVPELDMGLLRYRGLRLARLWREQLEPGKSPPAWSLCP